MNWKIIAPILVSILITTAGTVVLSSDVKLPELRPSGDALFLSFLKNTDPVASGYFNVSVLASHAEFGYTVHMTNNSSKLLADYANLVEFEVFELEDKSSFPTRGFDVVMASAEADFGEQHFFFLGRETDFGGNASLLLQSEGFSHNHQILFFLYELPQPVNLYSTINLTYIFQPAALLAGPYFIPISPVVKQATMPVDFSGGNNTLG